MTRRRPAGLRGKEVVDALTSPLRMEILQSFGPKESLTVQDLARRLGKPQESLYYHVRKLVAVGALVESEKRLKGKRYETLYRAAGERIVVAHDTETQAGRDATRRLLASILRTASREASGAIDRTDAGRRDRVPLVRRERCWLTAADRRRVARLLDEVEEICSRRGGEGRGDLYAVTLLMVPLEKPASFTSSSP